MDLKLVFARQFGNPQGLAGQLVGRLMAQGNGGFNEWVYSEIAQRTDPGGVSRVLEVGHGPGLGLQRLLVAFPQAEVVGLDQSAAMISQARSRNRTAIDDNRLQLQMGDVTEAPRLGSFDLITAVHVIYFWPDPLAPLTALREALTPGGMLALGMFLRADMPAGARENFPRFATRLYETEDDVRGPLAAAGLRPVEVLVKPDAPGRHGPPVLAAAA